MLDFARQRRWKRLNRGYSPRFDKVKLVSTLTTCVFLSLLVLILLTTILFAWYGRDLPRPDRVKRVEGLSTIIYDRNGEVLYDIYREQNRVPVELSEVPKSLQEATIAIEDKDFYKHQGFSSRGMLRAIFNIVLYRKLQGGSTLTQQLVKNVLLTSERTLPRKIKEFILAVQIERKYTKDEILQMYLNEAPYGGTAWGVETASQMYFGKHTKDLTLLEGAILAGLPQKPSIYSPFSNSPKSYIWRTEQVLRRMREDGYITKMQEEELKRELPNIQFSSQGQNIKAPHFVMYIKEQLISHFGEKMVAEGGLRVWTTLDLKIQEAGEKIVAEEVEKMKNFKIGNGAATVLNPKNGEILAMIGSKDYFAKDYDGNVNVTLSLRQPGSAIKPVTYLTAFKKGYTPSTLIMDVETHFPAGAGKPDYVPKNYDGKFHGPVQVRFALGNSINMPAVKTLAMVGVKEMLKNAYEMGFSTLAPTDENVNRFGLSITLGGGEVRLLDMVKAYSAFANGGYKVESVSILKVTDSRGKVLFENKELPKKQIITASQAFLVSHILLDNNARLITFGPNSFLVIPGHTVAAKTGTTDDKRDNWTIGWTPSFVVGTWVGNNDNSSMTQLVSGVSGAAPIWRRIFMEILKGKPAEDFVKPDDIVALEVDAFTGGLPKEGYPKRTEYFIKGTEPTSISPVYKKLKISKENGKLANETEITRGNFEEKEFIEFKEDDPVSTDGKNRWQEGIDAWLEKEPDPKYHPPTETSTAMPAETPTPSLTLTPTIAFTPTPIPSPSP